MPRTMYDSVTPTDIPTSAQMVAGYVDGIYAWPDSGWQRFPNARKVTITVGSGTLDANVADVENGDYTPTQAAAWAKRKLAAGQYPVLYFSLSNWPAIKAALIAAIGSTDPVGAWVADWDGKAALQTGWLAKQYANPTLSRHHYDLSIVADYWPGVDPVPGAVTPPAPVPAPTPPAAGAASGSLDQVRAAYARLADALVHTFQEAIAALEQAKTDLSNL